MNKGVFEKFQSAENLNKFTDGFFYKEKEGKKFCADFLLNLYK